MSSLVLQLSAIETVVLNRVFTMANGTISSLKEQADFSQKPVPFIYIIPLAEPFADTRLSGPWEAAMPWPGPGSTPPGPGPASGLPLALCFGLVPLTCLP